MTNARLQSTKPSDDEVSPRDDGSREADALDLPVDDVIELQGDVAPIDQDALLDTDELEHRREPTRTELDAGYTMPTWSTPAARRRCSMASTSTTCGRARPMTPVSLRRKA